ncbi:ankyrin repeat domain-containing protein 26 [Pelodytes ibericus]
MKKIISFAKRKKRGLSPSASETGSVLSAGYELKDKDLGKLHRAALSGDVSKIKQLLKKHDINQLDKENRTPLHLACANGHVDAVTLLIDNKPKLNVCDYDNRSPLMKAIQCQQERCAAVLLEHNADPNVIDINGNAALHLAARIPSMTIAVQLLERGAEIDAPNKEGCTPLMLAVTEHNEEMVEFFIKEGANVNARDKNQRTSLMIAANDGHINLVKMLLQNDADVLIRDEKGWTADDHAVMNGCHACSHLIIEHSSRKKTNLSPYPAASKKNSTVFSSPDRVVEGGFALGSPAIDKDVPDDSSQASQSQASQKTAGPDSWLSSDDNFDVMPQNVPKPNLKKLFHTKTNVNQKYSITTPQPVDFPLQSKSDSEEDSLGGSDDDLPQPASFPQTHSFPQSVHSTPGSFAKFSQVSPYVEFNKSDTGSKNVNVKSHSHSAKPKQRDCADEIVISNVEDAGSVSPVENDGDGEEEEEQEDGEEEQEDGEEEEEQEDGEEEEEQEDGEEEEEQEDGEEEEEEQEDGEEEEEEQEDDEKGEEQQEDDEKGEEQQEDDEKEEEQEDDEKEEEQEDESENSEECEYEDASENDISLSGNDGCEDEMEKVSGSDAEYTKEDNLSENNVKPEDSEKNGEQWENAMANNVRGNKQKYNDEAMCFPAEIPKDASEGKKNSLSFQDTQAISDCNDVPVSLIVGFYDNSDENATSLFDSDVTVSDVASIMKSHNQAKDHREMTKDILHGDTHISNNLVCSSTQKVVDLDVHVQNNHIFMIKDNEHQNNRELIEHCLVDSNLNAEDTSSLQSAHMCSVNKSHEEFNNVDLNEGSDFEDSAEKDAIKEELPKQIVEQKLKDLGTPIGRKETLRSELGLEDDDIESPWDSDSSESPRKQSASDLPPPSVQSHMQCILEDSHEDMNYNPSFLRPSGYYNMPKQDVCWSFGQSETNQNISQTKYVSPGYSLIKENETNVKSDIMDDLHLDDADDIEDISDWDSSHSPKYSFGNPRTEKVTEDLSLNPEPAVLEKVTSALPESEAVPEHPTIMLPSNLHALPKQEDEDHMQSTTEKRVPNSPKTSSQETESNNGTSSDENIAQSKCISVVEHMLKTSNLTISPGFRSPVDNEVILQYPPESPKTLNLKPSTESLFDSEQPWEERYERLWVDHEKRDVKTHFKDITAELKQKFGEITETKKKISITSTLPAHEETIHAADSQHPCTLTVTDEKSEREKETAVLAATDFVPEIEVTQTNRFSLNHSKFPHSRESVQNKVLESVGNNTTRTDNAIVPSYSEEKGSSTLFAQSTYKCKPFSGLEINCLKEATDKHILQPDLYNLASISLNKKISGSIIKTADNMQYKGLDSTPQTEPHTSQHANAQFENSSEVTKKPLDNQLEQDMQRFKNEVGMLQTAFLNLARGSGQLHKEVGQKDNVNNDSLNIKPELLQAGDSRNVHRNNATSETQEKPKGMPTCTSPGPALMYKMAVATINMKKRPIGYNKMAAAMKPYEKITKGFTKMAAAHELSMCDREISHHALKQREKDANSVAGAKNTKLSTTPAYGRKNLRKQRTAIIGKPLEVLDDSTLSETSQEEAKRVVNKSASENSEINLDNAEEFDDYSQSSDTATDEFESPAFRNAMLLIEQLNVNGQDSLNILKIQNIIRNYERSIQKESGRYAFLALKIKTMESERRDLQQITERNRELNSMLEHQKLESDGDLNNLRFTLKQEKEKRKSAEMLYEKSRDQLRKKEDQCCKEMEVKQQLEITLRNMELELRSLRNSVKQVEEERNEAQRLLSQEHNARVIQEGLLNNLRRSNEEEETRILAKSSEILNQSCEAGEREEDLVQKNLKLQDELTALKQELENVRCHGQEGESRYIDENEILREKVEDLRRDLKMNEETLTQTVIQYNGQLNVLKTEATMLCTKLEHEKQAKERLETEVESYRSRLTSALQDLETNQTVKTEIERTLQREKDEWMRSKDKLSHELSSIRENNNNLSQQLSRAETKCNSLECELHRTGLDLQEKVVLLESTQQVFTQSQGRINELERTLQLEKDQTNKGTVKQESMQERLEQIQSENMQLRQQLEDLQSKGIMKDKVVSDVQDRFTDLFAKLRTDTKREVHLVEERNKDLINRSNDLREQVNRLETEKVERESEQRQLQQELADALKKLSMSEASLEIITHYRNDLEEEKQNLQKKLEKNRIKLQDSEKQFIQSEQQRHQLKNLLDDKEREITAAIQKVQELSATAAVAEISAKQLEEHVQRLEIENAKMEATTKHQEREIESIQMKLKESVSMCNRFEDLIVSLQSSKNELEEKLNQQVNKQKILSQNAQDSHNLWEEELKSRTRLDIRLEQLDREKAALVEQVEVERKNVKRLMELKKCVESRYDQEMKINSDLQRERTGLKKLLKTTKKKLKAFEEGSSHKNLETTDSEIHRLNNKIQQLSINLERESQKYVQLESINRDLHMDYKQLEKGKRQLEDELAELKQHLESHKMDQTFLEKYKTDIEEKGRQELRQKLEEVNLFLQSQAASQEALEQLRAVNSASIKNQLEGRIQELQTELHRLKMTQQENVFQKESTLTELHQFRDMYATEMKMRKSLTAKLERANERLEEVNAKLHNERHRFKALIASSIVNGSLSATPVLDRNSTINRSFGLGGSFLSSVGNGLTTDGAESYFEKVKHEFEKNIKKELEQANTEPETGHTRVSPVGSLAGSLKNLNTDQDPVSRATQQYLEVLKKNYKI